MMLEFKAVHMNIWFSGFVLHPSACISRKSRLRRYRYLGCIRRLVRRRSHRKVGASRADSSTTISGNACMDRHHEYRWGLAFYDNWKLPDDARVCIAARLLLGETYHCITLLFFFLLNPLKIDTLNDRFKLCCLSIIFRSCGRGQNLRNRHYLAWVSSLCILL